MYETTKFIFGMPIPHADLYWLNWLVIPIIVFAIYIIQNFKLYFVPLYLYIFSYTLYCAFNMQYAVQDYSWTLHLKLMALGCLIPLLIPLLIKDFPKYLVLSIAGISVIYPILGNHSLTACFMLCLMAYYGFSWIYPIAIIMHPTALGLGGLGFYWLLKKFGNKAYLCFLFIPILASGRIEFLSNSGRFHLWAQIWQWYWHRHRIWFGYGPGSFLEYGPNITQAIEAPDFYTLYFIFAHNEALQFLFEYGIVGIVLLIPAVWKMRHEKWFPFFALSCAFNWPFRSALFSIWMCWTILVFTRKRAYTSLDS